MIIYYGVIGTSKFGIDDTGSGLWDGWIVMSGPRPDVDYYASENGEWLPDPSPQEIQLMIAEAVTKKALSLSQASDMIGALTDEIEGLEDNDDNVLEKLRTDLKAWKQYRVAVKNIDVSFAPDIEWPLSPEQNNITPVDISELTR
ncbi:tail fiber assembly protein [Yersinia frederiksenii]|uniref:tail fiber assembly protein n=1 Tax=Yersinia frederiksenii TaxID=29484 RepID=UPI0011A208B3|nr:tail fiber assembly protein [Yersinia frederiksenii]